MSGKPTWNAARGTASGVSKQVSAKDVSGVIPLKVRQPGQQTRDEVAQRNMREELLEREAKAKAERDKAAGIAPVEEAPAAALLEHRKEPAEDERGGKKQKVEEKNIDADDSDSSDQSSSSSEESADEEDEEAELMRELEKIKKERAEEAARKAAAEADRRAESMVNSNPLLSGGGDAALKKKWYEETVFRHQAKDDGKGKKKRFINDTTRNDFHRRFLDRFVQ